MDIWFVYPPFLFLSFISGRDVLSWFVAANRRVDRLSLDVFVKHATENSAKGLCHRAAACLKILRRNATVTSFSGQAAEISCRFGALRRNTRSRNFSGRFRPWLAVGYKDLLDSP